MMIRQWSGITEPPPEGLEIFLHNLKYYDDIYVRQDSGFRKVSCVPFDISMARNSMVCDLAFPTGFPALKQPDQSDNWEFIKSWLKRIVHKFPIMIISDYFDESMIMLKRMMCWSQKDILYKRLNTWNTKYKPEYNRLLIENYNRWSAVDHLAFEFFNRTLWTRIERWGKDDFLADVSHYKKTTAKVLEFCRKVTQKYVFTIESSLWDSRYEVTRTEFKLIVDNMRNKMKETYDAVPATVEQIISPRDVPGC